MITVRLKGGLGNQLFQYAVAYAHARRTDSEMNLDIRFYGNKLDRAYKLGNLNIAFPSLSDGNLPGSIDVLNNKYLNKMLRKLCVKKAAISGVRYLFDTSLICLNPELNKSFSGDTYGC